MGDYVAFALIAGSCCLVTGIGLFFLLRPLYPSRQARLGIAVPSALLAFASALLIPPFLAVLRGITPLPYWTALLFPILLLLCIPAFWRSVRNRRPTEEVAAPVATDSLTPPEFFPAFEEMKAPLFQPVSENNMLAEIAAAKAARQYEPAREFTPSAKATRPGDTEEAPSADVSALPADARFENVVEIYPARIPLVPEPVPPWVPFLRLLDKAWEERSAGRPVQAASWFLACLSRSSSAPVREEILMDLCALLKEHGYVREAMALLSSDIATGSDDRILAQIRSELQPDPVLHK